MTIDINPFKEFLSSLSRISQLNFQLWDGKGKIDVEAMEPKRLAAFAGICGKTLAFAHARSGDAMMIHGYIGDDEIFDDVMVEFADRYADRTEQDHAQLLEKIDHGTIQVVRDI